MTAAFHATPAPRRLARGLSRAALLALGAAAATAGVTTACSEDDDPDVIDHGSVADAYGGAPGRNAFDGGADASDASADGDAADGDGG